LVIFILRRKTVRGNDVLILGLCNSGKTLLFTRLLVNKVVDTYISVKENKSSLTFNNHKSLNIIDIPGSDSIRLRIFDQYILFIFRAIIFLIDGSTIQKEIKNAAEYLYTVLTDNLIMSNQVPLLIACNKQDLGFAKGSTLIKSALEKELNQLRHTKSAALDGVDGKSSTSNCLGNPRKDFSFSDLKKNETQFIEISCKRINEDSSDVESVKEWISNV
ncbi:hypothetical protein HELRODRAFT_92244, partial [Helobdella robusta]|uniref:Signal recognition particle receptor subunit beta n=1 Tax=Helobdella robusta TaxID=6412 RepID=T1G8D4_HELRO